MIKALYMLFLMIVLSRPIVGVETDLTEFEGGADYMTVLIMDTESVEYMAMPNTIDAITNFYMIDFIKVDDNNTVQKMRFDFRANKVGDLTFKIVLRDTTTGGLLKTYRIKVHVLKRPVYHDQD
jgi:hypothetical protein